MNTMNLVTRIIKTFAGLAIAGLGVTVVSKGKVKYFYTFYMHSSR